jgi:putative Mg2+ transporter-C (MgtC) family protein
MIITYELEMVVRLLLASLLGGVIGLEREIHGRPAGFRTHLLVSLGSCLFVVTSIEFYREFGNFTGVGMVGVDPGRIAAQVVTGIGFLGAGAIIREKASVRGLTTAACLWVASAIGLACGIGLFTIASAVTVIALLSLLLLKKVENWLSRDIYVTIKIWADYRDGLNNHIEKLLEQSQLHPLRVRFEKSFEGNELFMEYDVKSSSRDITLHLIDTLGSVAGVKKICIE